MALNTDKPVTEVAKEAKSVATDARPQPTAAQPLKPRVYWSIPTSGIIRACPKVEAA